MKRPELLAPAGSFEKLKAAVRYGADAVYVGGTDFGLRAASKNFSDSELKSAVEYCHERGKKLYVTVNIIARNDDIERLPAYLSLLNEIKPDALIIADIGVMSLAKKYAPDVPIHVSTQANATNYMSALEYYKLGASRVILARELSLREIKQMHEKLPKELELEAFVHGAMCISYSGRCHLSNYMAARDGNHGECAQPCRWKYFLMEEKRPGEFYEVFEEENGAFILNSKDLNMIEHIPKLIDAGISSFKIEGRVKTEYYVATVVNAYRQAIDAYCADPEGYVFDKRLLREVLKVSHRAYHTGFFFGHPKESGQVYESSSYIREYEVAAVVEKDSSAGALASCTQRNKFKKGDRLEILTPGRTGEEFTVSEMYNENGETIEAAPHPTMALSLRIPFDVKAGDMLRRQK
ncbi:MAG: U32 family peptidase [Clostridia bacterium]|nr:U32 family peptidase [Clostridia bacterium]